MRFDVSSRCSMINIENFLYMLILFFIVFYFVLPGYYKIYPYLVSLLGIVMLVFSRSEFNWKPLVPVLSMFLFASAADMYNYAIGETSLSDFEKIIRNVVLVFPFIIFLSRSSIQPIHLLLAFSGLFAFSLAFALLQKHGYYAQNAAHYNGQAPGIWFNKGSFSAAIVLFFAIFAGFSLYVKGSLSKVLLLVTYVFMCWLLYLTQARGPLLAFVFISVFVAVFFVSGFIKSKKKLIVLCVLISCIGVALLFTVFGDRFSTGISQLAEHFDSGSQPTSVSIRLDTWQLAWDVFRQSPVWGAGAQGSSEIKEVIVQSGKYPAYILKYHTHSEYFMTLERGGIIGLLGLLWLLVYPFYNLRSAGVAYKNMCPLFLVVGSFMIIGITSATIRNNIGANSFLLCLLFAYFFSYKYFSRESV